MKSAIIEAAVANHSEAMEIRDHFKNGASSKSLIRRGNWKMHKILFFVLTIAVAAMCACSSAKRLSSVDISPLKGQKEVNLVLDFSETTVSQQPEESHIAHNTKDKNEEDAAKWLKEWNEDLRLRSYSLLMSNLNERLNEIGLSAGNYPNAEYTIHVKVKNITPGYFAGIMNKPSWVQSDVNYVKTGETTPFATVGYNQPGMYVPYHVERIAQSFRNLGGVLGRDILKNL